MTDQPKRNLWPLVAVLVLLPVLYLASLGPVWWLWGHGFVGDEAAGYFMPADVFCRYAPARVGDWLRTYIKWFG